MRRLIWVCLVLVYATFSYHVSSQTEAAPLFLTLDGDLWAWHPDSGSLELVTDEGYIRELAISPDNTQLAYVMLDNYNTYDSTFPADVWVMDISSGVSTRITPQATPDAPKPFRTSPTWSPDGTQLAWNENHQLVIYDHVADSTTIAGDLPGGFGDAGHIAVAQLQWGGGGIMTFGYGYHSDFMPTGSIVTTLIVINPEDESVYTAVVNHMDLNIRASLQAPQIWISDGNHDTIGLAYGREAGRFWDIVDPQTGETRSTHDMPEMVSRTHADSSVAVLQDANRQWWIIAPDDTAQPITFSNWVVTPQFTLSPTGEYVAYRGESVVIWHDGNTQVLVEDEAIDRDVFIAWGAAQWRIREDDRFAGSPIPPDTLPECDFPPQDDLTIGAIGHVRQEIGGLRLPLFRHANPFRMADQFIGAGDTFTVLAGSACPQDGLGFIWWQIDYNGTVGWVLNDTVFTTDDGFYLEMLNCDGFQTSRLAVGERGQVIAATSANNLRAEPSTSSEVLTQIPVSGLFTVLAGPRCGENSAWWQVDYNGTIGWTAEGQGDTYWLEPLP